MAHSVKPRGKLELSEIHLSQQQLLNQDVDLENFYAVFRDKLGAQHRIQLREAIVSAEVSRTIDGASTLKVGIIDRDRSLLRSGRLHNKLDVQIDGLWWRLAQFEKQGSILDLTFEDREVSILRKYNSVILPISRSKITRAEFVLRMLHEVKQFDIPYYIPELHKTQPVFDKNDVVKYPVDRAKGINSDEKLTVKGQAANFTQKLNADAILTTGDMVILPGNPHKHKILVSSIMTAIQESSLTNLPFGDRDSQGVFQQRPSQGWIDTMDVAIQAREYFVRAIANDAANPNYDLAELAQSVQRSAFPRAYDQWKDEAKAWVAAFGALPRLARAANAQKAFDDLEGQYRFYRGEPPSRKHANWKPEDTWTCIQRLVDEVGWRAFFVSGVFYMMSEDDLFKSMPRTVMNEDNDGVDSIDGDVDQNKPTGLCTVTLRMGRYDIPPGCTIKIVDTGPLNGRWLVETIDRDLFNVTGTLTCKKPDPELAEPLTDSLPSDYSFSDYEKQGEPVKPYESGPATLIAEKILRHHDRGEYRDDNGSQISQWRKVASGSALHNRCGDNVRMSQKLAATVLWLLDNGWMVGTIALTEDHDCYVQGSNPPRKSQHVLGEAVDISSLGKKGQGWRSLAFNDAIATGWAKEVMLALRALQPKQIICNGVGKFDPAVGNLQWNNGEQVSYITDDHTDHIHVGV